MLNNSRNLLAALFLVALSSLPIAAMAADEACTGITKKCTKDKPYDKTIGGKPYSCYDCTQALCKNGGSGGLSGTATSSVCTEKATTFQPISLDDQFSGGDTLAPKPTSPRRAGSAVDPRSNTGAKPDNVAVRVTRDHRASGDPVKFDEADAIFGKRTRLQSASPDSGLASPPVETDRRRASHADERDHRSQGIGTSERNVILLPGDLFPIPSRDKEHRAGSAETTRDHRDSPDNRADLTAPDGNVVAAPLTIQECTGLGGTEISTNTCSALGQKACATVDKHGVIRVACIDKVAN